MVGDLGLVADDFARLAGEGLLVLDRLGPIRIGWMLAVVRVVVNH